jgi:hypothetical protein
MKVAQLFEDAAEHVFQLRLACKQLQKLGYNPSYVNDWTRVVTKDYISVPSVHGTDMSVNIKYHEDDFQDKPWQVLWYNRGILQLSEKFADFQGVIDDIEPIGPLKEGVGQQVMLFTDYLEHKFPGSKAGRVALEKFGSYLFKQGYTYSEGPSNGDFTKGSVVKGKLRVVVPQKHWPAKTGTKNPRDHVALHYFHDDPDGNTGATSRSGKVNLADVNTMANDLDTWVRQTIELYH